MEFRPLHPDLGVEVIGFDPARDGAPEEIAQLREAYARHSLLLFRGGERIAPGRQLEIASWFGPPPPVANSADGEYVTMLANDAPGGSLRLPFHSDLTYTDAPVRGICLHAIALPSNPTTTSFVSGVAAWRGLPEAMREELNGKTLRHRLDSFAGTDWPTFIADHPVRLTHPATGEPVLFVTEHHAERILEMDGAQSDRVLAALFARLYAPERIHVHSWRRHDLLIFDNLALQHARTEHSDPGEGERALQRVALAERTLDELVETARRRAAPEISV